MGAPGLAALAGSLAAAAAFFAASLRVMTAAWGEAFQAALLHLYYYSGAATRMLGKVPGMGQPEDTPLVFTLLFLAVVLVQRELFDGWPLRRAERT